MAEISTLIYVKLASDEGAAHVLSVMDRYSESDDNSGSLEGKEVLDDVHVVASFLFGSDAPEVVDNMSLELSSCEHVCDVRAYYCGDDEPWEKFVRVIQGELETRDYYPFDDEELDAEEFSEGVYAWWHDGILEEVRAGMLQDNIDPGILGRDDGRQALCEIDIAKFKKSYDSYIFVEFSLIEGADIKLKNSIKRAIKQLFDSGQISKTQTIKSENRMGYIFLGYLWPDCVIELFSYGDSIEKIFDHLGRYNADNISVRFFHKEIPFDEVFVTRDKNKFVVSTVADGVISDSSDIAIRGRYIGNIKSGIAYLSSKNEQSLESSDPLQVVSDYCLENQIAMSDILERKWRRERFVFIDYAKKKTYAVSCNDVETAAAFMAKKLLEQKDNGKMGVVNVYSKEICVVNSSLEFESRLLEKAG